MRQLITLLLLLFVSTLTRGQSYKGTQSLSYETPFSKNGLRYTQLALSWEVQKPGFFGDIVVIFDASASPNYTEYIYQGKPYYSHGEEESVFRRVRVTSFRVRARVEGPGYNEEVVLDGVLGMGGGAFFGNSKYLLDAKTKEAADVKNWTVTPLSVIDVSWDGGWDLQQLIDRKASEQRKQEAFAQAQNAGQEAAGRQDWVGAIREFEKAKRIAPANSGIDERIAHAKEQQQKKGLKERYEDLLQAARQAEGRNDKAGAKRLYDQAAATGHDDPAASQASERIARQLAEDDKRRQEELAAKEAEEEANTRQLAETKEKQLQEQKEKLEALKQAQAAAAAARHDSLRLAMAADEQRKWDEARQKQLAEAKAQEEAEEKKREEELQADAAERRENDKAYIAYAEQNMAYDPEKYAQARLEARQAYDAANEVKPYEALQLQREWWDNNAYIQVIADELYETQRQDNQQRYVSRLYEEHAAFNKAKFLYIAALEFVDRGSSQHQHLLKQIEQCNKEIDFNKVQQKGSYRMEVNRRKYREQAKMMAIAQQRAVNHDRAAAAFLIYEMQTPEGGNRSEHVLDKMAFEERLNKADAQYKQDAAITGMGQAVTTNVLFDENKVAEVAQEGAFMINARLGGLISIENTPMLMNHTSDVSMPETKTDDLMTIPFFGALDIWIRRSRLVDFGISGGASMGVFPMKGIAAFTFSWHGKARLDFGGKRFKLAQTVEHISRYGSQTVDYDVIHSENNPYYQFQNHTATGEFDYTVLRVGTGIKLDLSDKYDDQFVLVQVFAENPSFYPGSLLQDRVYSYRAEGQFGSGVGFTLAFAQNYVVAGQKEYRINEPKNHHYWNLQLSKTWTLFNSHAQ
ncbi:hypothetical protein [Solirubrum puertoriconensis]|uniref:Uncharacterized protein n=1 Tax=Solirubrum puertoriconensis TaxID=1751427 RepID=A0A9X0L5Z0_SOLP1|nr:hypothetical protein [Solirubrum puertoriconensis]KUG09124.1 hypothetical protein ASU33_20110 [Solirubrum puertoriconensis]